MHSQRASSVIFLLLTGLLVSCSARVDDNGTPMRVVREINHLMDDVAANELARDPELATQLGLPEEDLNYPFQNYLTDRSQAAYERTRVQRLETLAQLRKAPTANPKSNVARDIAVVLGAYEVATEISSFGHGQTNLGIAYPYVTDHMRGAYADVPKLLIRNHPGRTAADARAYILRLRQLPDAIDDERRRMFADAASGVVPPDFILRNMERAAAELSAGAPIDHPLTVGLGNLLTGPDDLTTEQRIALEAEGLAVVRDQVIPAYTRFRAALNALTINAPSEPGVWQLPEGAAYYAAAIEAYTEEGQTPEALYQLGRSEVRALTEQLDTALIAAGYDTGTVGQRLANLATLPEQIYADDEIGKAALLAAMNEHLTAAQNRLDDILEVRPRTPVTIQSLQGFMATTAPAAAYMAARADGTAPGTFSLNISDPSEWPAFTLPTLVYHETVPGHHVEAAMAAEIASLPRLRQLIWNTAYGEGWSMYAEDLADEMGLYEDDPLGRIGYLQSLLFRAARLVVDTGIHHERWSREEAVQYLVETTGQNETAMRREVDRYTVWPGQAAAYWVGRKKIKDLRERARRVMGPDFDLKAFHQEVLKGGPRALSILEKDIERWYSAPLTSD
jgi:uncharacterized protein (DUF885 family)